MKVELKIDGVKVQMDQNANIAVTHSIADIQEPDRSSAGYSKSVEVPLIPYNMRVFRFTNELYSKEQFNNELHTAEYLVDGNTVMSGIAQIDKITYKFGTWRKLIGGSFHVSVIGAAFEWITRAKRQMNELVSDETVKYAMQEVYDNSVQSDVSLIKFFPVDRGAFWKEEGGVKVPRTYLELKDYHPFFNVWKAMGLIFSGYTVNSSMKDLFERLYCSGYIPEQEDLSYIKEENDFKGGTTHVGESVAHYSDYAFFQIHLFDRWTSENGDYFVATDGIIQEWSDGTFANSIFCPTRETIVAFDIKLSYGSTVGKNGEYIDTFYFGAQSEKFTFSIQDSNEGKEKYYTDYPWWPIRPKDNFLFYLKLNNPSDVTGIYRVKEDENGSIIEETLIAPIKALGQYLYLPWLDSQSGRYCYKFKNGDYVTFGKGWFTDEFGAVQTTNGKINFNVTLRTGSHLIPTGGRYALKTTFRASNSLGLNFGNKLVLTIEDDSEITPVFGNDIAINEPVGISTVGGTNSQLDYIAALRQMFNLMFYTNPLTKEVFIEPRTRFYNPERSDIVDWRGKIDYSKEIEIEELGGDVGNALKLAYADGNEVVQYYNWKNRTELGAYKEALLNKTSDDTKEVVNGMFAPFLLRTVESVGMTILQEKREKTQDTIDDVELDITPVIGYFNDVVERTAGSDRVGKYSHYPQLIFKDASKAINLGFDDIDYMPTEYGLNQYYQDNISAYNVGRRITMYLKLEPQDVEAFQFPNRGMQDFRAVFLLNIDGEDVPCLLESIEDYNPASGASTKCVFISDPNMNLTGSDLTVITYDDVAIGRNNTLLGYK